MKKRIVTALCLLALLLWATLGAAAAEAPDMERTGSITLELTYEGEPVSGGTLTLYPAALGVLNPNGEYVLEFTLEFAECGISLDDLSSPETAQALAQWAQERSAEGQKAEIDEEGRVSFENLPLGLYLLVQETPAEGFDVLRPFLVTVPVVGQDGLIYDVNAAPKVTLERAPTEPSEPTEPTDPTVPSEPDLPQTGQNKWPIPVMAAIGATLFIAGCCLVISDRRKDNEN